MYAHPFNESNKTRDIISCIGGWIDIDFGLAIHQTISLSFRRRGGRSSSRSTDLNHRINLCRNERASEREGLALSGRVCLRKERYSQRLTEDCSLGKGSDGRWRPYTQFKYLVDRRYNKAVVQEELAWSLRRSVQFALAPPRLCHFTFT